MNTCTSLKSCLFFCVFAQLARTQIIKSSLREHMYLAQVVIDFLWTHVFSSSRFWPNIEPLRTHVFRSSRFWPLMFWSAGLNKNQNIGPLWTHVLCSSCFWFLILGSAGLNQNTSMESLWTHVLRSRLNSNRSCFTFDILGAAHQLSMRLKWISPWIYFRFLGVRSICFDICRVASVSIKCALILEWLRLPFLIDSHGFCT